MTSDLNRFDTFAEDSRSRLEGALRRLLPDPATSASPRQAASSACIRG